MNVRQRYELTEKTILSGNAVLSQNSKGRIKQEPECEIRTCFQRDRDRILHCNSFRRLKHKTQVFLAPKGDHYRTRLTHTLEVSQIARTIARALRLNEDLVEAIAMGHDLGHTPFGHAGERALNEITPSGFKHNLQSVRIVEKLEKEGKGLNLTYEVKNGISTHCSDYTPETLEGKIVQVSDKIAYINHDIEDAIRAEVLKVTDLPYDSLYVLGQNKNERINNIIKSIVEHSENDIIMSDEILKAHLDLRKFMFEYVYKNEQVEQQAKKAQDMLKQIYFYYINNFDKIPKSFKSYDNGIKEQVVCDYIAGMTDQYAINIYKDIFIPKSWSL